MRGCNFNQNIRQLVSLTSGSGHASPLVSVEPSECTESRSTEEVDCVDLDISKYRVESANNATPSMHRHEYQDRDLPQQGSCLTALLRTSHLAQCIEHSVMRALAKMTEKLIRCVTETGNNLALAHLEYTPLEHNKAGRRLSDDPSPLRGSAFSRKSVDFCLNTSLPFLYGRSHEQKNAYQRSALRRVSYCHRRGQATP